MSTTHHKAPAHREVLRRRCAGIVAITAIAILVVLALLGTFIVSLSGIQERTLALDLLGSRAYQAARSGIEWIAYQVLNPENTNPAGGPYTVPYACVASTNIAGLAGDLAGYTVTVTCNATTYTEFGNTVRMYQVTATACNIPTGGACPNNATASPSYAERQITSVMATCRLPSGASC
jgi:MSHA biogenesis protein MshP